MVFFISSPGGFGHPELWLPGRRLGDPDEAVLFDQLCPEDVTQGSLGFFAKRKEVVFFFFFKEDFTMRR